MKITMPMVIYLVQALNDRAEKEYPGKTFYPLTIELAPTADGTDFRISFMGNDVYNSLDADPDDPDTLASITKEILEELKDVRDFLNAVVKH